MSKMHNMLEGKEMKMKLKILLVILLFFQCQILLAEDGWYAFDLTKTMDKNSPANMGNLVLDAPAGKHGFVQTQNEKFIFEDGEEAKFWGTNLVAAACFPTKEESDKMAEQIAFLGFNSVRFHLMDVYFESRGIFEDVDYAYPDYQQKRTGFFSDEQFDRLDYLISRLKSLGIYVDLGLLVYRGFTKADGVINAQDLNAAAKPASLFDPRLIELQKQYAEGLLTHFNPYTGLKYSDDPAIALIEIVNEDSIIAFWRTDKLNDSASIPDYYITQLDTLWNNWLEDKYETPENVNQAWGLGDDSEQVISEDGSEWNFYAAPGTDVQKQTTSGVTIFQINQTTGNLADVSYRDYNLELSSKKSYIVSFTGSADKSLSIVLSASENSQNMDLWEEIDLSTTPQSYEFTFVPPVDGQDAKVGLYLGCNTGEITIENLQIKEKGMGGAHTSFDFLRPIYSILNTYSAQTQSDIKDFYIGIQKSFFKEMNDFLKITCGVKCPITGNAGIFYPEDTESEIECDYVDTHAYWDHPDRDGENFEIHNKSLIKNYTDWDIIDRIEWVRPEIDDRPYTVTEWNQCYPNNYAYELPVYIASEALQKGWDGLFQFDFNRGGVPFDEANIQHFFVTSGNPQQRILTPLGSMLFLKNDGDTNLTANITNDIFSVNSPSLQGVIGFIKDQVLSPGFFNVISSEDGAVLMYSPENVSLETADKLVLVTVSEVKNTNSGWNPDGTFNWGIGPTLLKNIEVQVSFTTEKDCQVFALDSTGTRSIEIVTSRQDNIVSFSTAGLSFPWFEIVLQDTQAPDPTPGTLNVTSTSSFIATGDENGPFSPSSKTFTLENTGEKTLSWSISKTTNWLTLSKVTGTLNAGETEDITLSINTNANSLVNGVYSDTVTISNTTNGNGNTSFSVSLTVNDVLETPSSISASDGASQAFIEIVWSGIADATYYNVYRSDTVDGAKTLLSSTTYTNYQDSSSSAGVNYYFWVKAVNDSVISDYSAYDIGYKKVPPLVQDPGFLVISSTAAFNSTGDEAGPFAPVNKTYAIENSGDLPLEWTITKMVPWITIDKTSGTLEAGENTIITVSINEEANSLNGGDYSEVVTFTNTTDGNGDTEIVVNLTVNEIVDIAIGVTATDATLADYVEITWNSVEEAVSYNVYRSNTIDGTKTLLGNVLTNSYQDTSAIAGITYYYFIKAVKDGIESDYSSSDAGAKKVTSDLSAVTDLTVSSTNHTSIRLKWTTPYLEGVDNSYDIRFSTSPITDLNWNSASHINNEPEPGASGTTAFFNIKGLSTETTYYFAAKIFDNVGNISALSNIASSTTKASNSNKVRNPQSLKDFNEVQSAYDDNETQTGDNLLVQNTVLEEDVILDDGKIVIIEVGYNTDYSSTDGVTAIEGNVAITDGEVIFTEGEVHFTSTSGEAIS